MTVRDMFEIIENLCDEYGIDKVETTVESILQAIKEWHNEERR